MYEMVLLCTSFSCYLLTSVFHLELRCVFFSKAVLLNKSFCVGEKNPGIIWVYMFSKKNATVSMHCIKVCLSLRQSLESLKICRDRKYLSVLMWSKSKRLLGGWDATARIWSFEGCRGRFLGFLWNLGQAALFAVGSETGAMLQGQLNEDRMMLAVYRHVQGFSMEPKKCSTYRE